MEKINWPEIIEEENDNIIDALEALYNDACCLNTNSEICQAIKIDSDGTLIHHTTTAEAITSSVWSGHAIELARMAWFNPLDDADEAEVISAYLSKEELQTFNQFLGGEKPSIKKLRQWNVAAADRVEKKFTEKYAADHAPVWAAQKMTEILKRAGEYGREATLMKEKDDLGKS
jgi:hypothetical protein